MPAGVGGGFNHHLIGTLANLHSSISYVTGAHNMKFGYQGGFSNPSQDYPYFNEVIAVRMTNGAPNRLTQTIVKQNSAPQYRPQPPVPTSFYGQDQWTTGRLTLQGGIRYDHLLTTYPESHVGGPGYTAAAPKAIIYPSRSTQGVHWDDVTPRMGAAYDLFGNGKTALKFNLGKYMQAFSATNTDLDLNPLIRTTISTTRTWTDSNKDFVVNCDLANPNKNLECGDMADKGLGKEVFTRSYDPNFVTGFGNRPYNWGPRALGPAGDSPPRVGERGIFPQLVGQLVYAVDNRSTSVADYTPFSIRAPLDVRLPGGGGQVVSGLYDLVPTKVGFNDELAQLSSNFTKQIENWQGVDVNVSARLRNGLTLQGGTSTGRKVADNCDLRTNYLPELGAGADGGANNSIADQRGTKYIDFFGSSSLGDRVPLVVLADLFALTPNRNSEDAAVDLALHAKRGRAGSLFHFPCFLISSSRPMKLRFFQIDEETQAGFTWVVLRRKIGAVQRIAHLETQRVTRSTNMHCWLHNKAA